MKYWKPKKVKKRRKSVSWIKVETISAVRRLNSGKNLPDYCVVCRAEIRFNNSVRTNACPQNIGRRWYIIIITNSVHVFEKTTQKKKANNND